MPDPAVSERVTSYPPAGLDRRFYALAVDRLMAWPVLAAGVYAAYRFLLADGDVVAGIAVIVALVLVIGVSFAVLAGTLGTSPGKAALGLRLVSAEEGRPIGIGSALIRGLVVALAGLPTFGLGLASLAWTALMDPGRQRRGWHDHRTDSIVVDVRPVAEQPVELVEAPRQVVNLTAMRLAPSPPPPAPVVPPTLPSMQPSTPTSARPASSTSSPATSPARSPTPAPSKPSVPPQPDPVPPGRAAGPAPGRPAHDAERTVVRGAPPRPAAPVAWQVTFDDGHTVLVDGLTLVGRRPEARPGEPVRHLIPLSSSDMSVSKTHAQLQVAPDGGLVVTDRGSTNGSQLVRSGVTRELPPGRPTTLLQGDEVRFGDRSMVAARLH
jgi:uncharacterized RDD family membrane protein YckC